VAAHERATTGGCPYENLSPLLGERGRGEGLEIL